MNTINDNIISEITVRLKRTDNTIIGTGILYYNKNLNDKVYLLTASHCLFTDGDRLQEKLDSICIDIYNPQRKLYQCITVESINEILLSKNELEDVAIVVLDKEEVDSINNSIPEIQVISERKNVEIFYTKGFPNATKGEELVAINAIWAQKMTESNRFQLQLNADYTETSIEGFSGAGISLEANNEIYLYGIFTRFREEEKGKVIYCQYIDSINELLKKNSLPLIDYSYLGENGLNSSWFANQVEKEIKNLGPRFNEELNFELPILSVFNCVSKNRKYHQNIITKVDNWITERAYRRLKDNEYLAEIETELESLRQEIKDWLIAFNDSFSVETEITLSPLREKIKIFDEKVSAKRREIYNISLEKRDNDNKPANSFDSELYRLSEIQNTNDKFISDIVDLKINLANHPTLIIQGEAGCGKSHLLGDIASHRKKQNLPTILLLGTTFGNTTIEYNILEKLGLKCTFKDFLENLNSIGLQINSRVLLLIDAINEGAGIDLWKHQIAGFINEVAKYPAVGLVLTIRSTYFHYIISDELEANPNITIIVHEGFKGNEYKALKLFCKHHNLKLPNFPILSPEFANPLLLHTICNALKNSPDKSFPKGFNGINKIYSLYKDLLNRKFEEKRPEYKLRNIVTVAIEKLAKVIFETKYQQMDVSDVVILFEKEFPYDRYLLSDLIEESVLIKMRDEYSIEDPKDIVLFSYQRLGDFFMAEELLKSYQTKIEIKEAFANDTRFKKIIDTYQWMDGGIIEALAILLPEKYDLELFEFIAFFLDKSTEKQRRKYTYARFIEILSDSLKWRELNSIDEKKITKWLTKHSKDGRYDEWLYTLTELAAIQDHPFNSDRLHRILTSYSMPKRDCFWQKHILWYSDYDDNKIAYPLRRLIDWAWLPNISYDVDSETARLVAQTLVWLLSSTNIALRDKTTKALVNLLEQKPEVLVKTLMAFENIDDLYILDRLYAVAYGCILRTEKNDSIKVIAQYIYDIIFKNGNPPTHILIRDYARNAIEYGIYKNVGLDVDVELIRPPYNSQCDFIPLSNEELDEKYELKENNGHWGKDEWGVTAILHSMTTEYGRGIGSYGDFGRYIFQSAISNFHLPSKLNVDLLSNLAVEWVFEKYGYNPNLHGKYDRMISDHYHRLENKIERIGKKYQWIAFYEILARVSDNYKIRSRCCSYGRYQFYKGAWQLYIRDIDPAYVTKHKDEDDKNLINQNTKEWWDHLEYNHWNYPDPEWVETIDDLVDPKKVIEKKDIGEEEWIHLEHFVEWKSPKKIGIEKYEGRRKSLCYIIQGCLVKKTEKYKIINYLKNKKLWNGWLSENENSISCLINREKFWSPAYLDISKDKELWNTIKGTKGTICKIIIATEPAKGSMEDDKSGANRLYSIPCRYIFEKMKLQYAPIDGSLKNVNGEIIVINNNPEGVLMRKKDLISFLDDNDLDIIWTLRGEKFSIVDDRSKKSYFKFPCGVYYLENGKLRGELKMYDRD